MKFLLIFVLVLPVFAQSIPLDKVASVYHARCTSTLRLAEIAAHRGDPASEQAVIDALHFFKNTQNKDGSWSIRRKVPMTALALLCYLGHGETTQSPEFGNATSRAINYLIKVAHSQKGKLASDLLDDHWSYEHAIAVQALAEAYALCEVGFGEDIPNLKRVVEVCTDILIKGQHKGGGWEYAYSQDSARGGDVSQTAWHLTALKAFQHTGLQHPSLNKTAKRALDYIERMQMPSGAIGYSSPRLRVDTDGTTLAALGAHSFQLWKDPQAKVARKAIRFLDKEMKFDWNSPNSDLYGHFFAAQAMHRQGGSEWTKYHDKVFPQLLKNQAPDGSFLAPNHGNLETIAAIAPAFASEKNYGKHYRTCLATLMLETYYRFLPASQ